MLSAIIGHFDAYSAAALVGLAFALCILGSIWLGNRRDATELKMKHDLAMKKQADDRDAVMFNLETDRSVRMASASMTVHSSRAIEGGHDGEG